MSKGNVISNGDYYGAVSFEAIDSHISFRGTQRICKAEKVLCIGLGIKSSATIADATNIIRVKDVNCMTNNFYLIAFNADRTSFVFLSLANDDEDLIIKVSSNGGAGMTAAEYNIAGTIPIK